LASIPTQKENGDFYFVPVKVWHGSRLKLMMHLDERGMVEPDASEIVEIESLVGRFHRWWTVIVPPAQIAPFPTTPYRIHGGVGPNSSSL
jgi:hypothetical protein